MIADIIRRNSAPLEPLETGVKPRFEPLDGVRAVLFDIYGTLFISASGDISLTSGASRADAAKQALQAVGVLVAEGRGDEVVAELHNQIKRHHSDSQHEYPEVDIYQVWRDTLAQLLAADVIDQPLATRSIETLAIEYETRVNPVWPMPGLNACLQAIQSAGLTLGIVSNAQAFTRELFASLAASGLSDFGFSNDLCIWSYAHLQAKPGRYLYEQAANALKSRGIERHETLYVGNDMRNDVAPAAAVGFKTVLFAGDARSLRVRDGDPLVAGVQADAVVTDLRQILSILRLAPASQ